MAVTLRPVSEDDDDFLYQVYASTRREEVAAWGWDLAQQEAFLQMQFRAQRFSYERDFERVRHSIILLDDKPVGRMLVNSNDNETRLVDIAILPEVRKTGIGTLLIEDLKAQAASEGKPIVLQVLKDNRGAIKLYERLGFVITEDGAMYLEMRWLPCELKTKAAS
jgi:ribosomal protein S18 acetylase RimI-like enzyme